MNCSPPHTGGKERGISMKFNLKRLGPVLFAIACACILGAVVMLVFLVPAAASTFYRFCLAAIAVLTALMGFGLLFFLFLSRDNDPNFFLYDMKSGRNIGVSELTFDRINSRMGYFMTTVAASQEQLWSDNVLATADPDKFGTREIYKPLAAYKMLYDLVELDKPEGWQLFICAPAATVKTLTSALLANGENDMADALTHAYNSAKSRDDIDWTRDFLMGNAKYLRRRMLNYVQKNMEWFY